MGIAKRIENLIIAFFMIISGIIMIYDAESGYIFVVSILSLSLAVYSIKTLIYYFSMARYMVGGKRMLYTGVILLEFAIFTMSLTDVPRFYIILYLAGCHIFSGIVYILRALEAKRLMASIWKYNMLFGMGNILIAIACFVFSRSAGTIPVIYGAGLIYSAVLRIIQAFKKTAIVYIS